eukprot:7339172-Lingulodinium_polyedra.AAC.1
MAPVLLLPHRSYGFCEIADCPERCAYSAPICSLPGGIVAPKISLRPPCLSYNDGRKEYSDAPFSPDS